MDPRKPINQENKNNQTETKEFTQVLTNETLADTPVLSPLSQDIKNEKIYPHLTLNVLGVFAQVSKKAEAETAFLRLLQSAVDAEPESYQWYDFVLMSSLGEYKKENAEKNKIYLADDGSYLVCDQEGIVREGKIDNKTLDLSNLQKKLHNPALKNKLFELISKAGHAPAYSETTQLAAIAILKRHPELLFREGMVTDHVGRKIKGSPYRIFLGTGDTWALKQVHEEILPKIENGDDLAKVEFQKQFPDYQGPWPLDPNLPEEALYDARNRNQIEAVQAQLQIIVAAITADPCTYGLATRPETTEAVAGLRKLFTPKAGEIIQTGLHFPFGIMREIYQVYGANFAPWIYAKLAFFSRTVVGSAEAALSVVDGQCVKSGLGHLNVVQGPDRRDGLFCHRPRGIQQDKAPLAGKLGGTVFVDPYDGESIFLSSTPGVFDWYNKNGPTSLRGLPLVGPALGTLEAYAEQKQQLLGVHAAIRREVSIPTRSP